MSNADKAAAEAKAAKAAAADAPVEKRKTYECCGIVHHDGVEYKAGDTLRLTSLQADPLLSVKAVKQAD